MVEAGGIEPPSESASTGTSPGAGGSFTFPYSGVDRHTQEFGSFMIHGALKALRTHVHHSSTPDTRTVVLPGRTAALSRSENDVIVVL